MFQRHHLPSDLLLYWFRPRCLHQLSFQCRRAPRWSFKRGEIALHHQHEPTSYSCVAIASQRDCVHINIFDRLVVYVHFQSNAIHISLSWSGAQGLQKDKPIWNALFGGRSRRAY